MAILSRVASALLAASVVCSPALAGDRAPLGGLVYELKLGVLAHDVPDLWSGFRLEHGTDINVEAILAPGLPFLGGTLRPAIGGSISAAGDTSRGYIDARWMLETRAGFFLSLGLGAAVHDGHLRPDDPDRKALGSRVLFHVPAEIGWRSDAHNSLSLYFEHVSNAGTASINEGLDAIGVRYGYRF